MPNAPTVMASGNVTTDSSGTPFTTNLAGSSYIAGVEGSTSDTVQGTVAVLGDQLTPTAPPRGGFRATGVVGTTNSYTVSAWVKLGSTGTATQTVVSQDGAQNSAFALQYTGTSANKWASTVFTGTGAISARVQSNNAVQTGTWTHLFGAY